MFRAIFIGLVVMTGISACAVTELFGNNPALQPSPGGLQTSVNHHQDFREYLDATKQHLIENKIYISDADRQTEFHAALPFELQPARSCRDKHPRGIVLVHGLGDTPLMMRDIGAALAQRCFLVRAVLLPGHGTRPGDLIHVSHRDWRDTITFAVESLKNDVDQVYISGFSLGGLLAMYHATQDSDIRGVIAFSPALHLPWVVSNSQWLKYLVTWVDVDNNKDYARYDATPINAAAQIYKVTKLLNKQLRTDPLDTPVFIAQSQDDAVINSDRNQSIFSHYITHPSSRLLVYRRTSEGAIEFSNDDRRVEYANSHLPTQRIHNYSHLSVHISPQNAHYGRHGDYRYCDDDYGADELAACQLDDNPWRGEIYQTDNSAEANRVKVRLTYNPQFESMLVAVDEFLESAERLYLPNE